MRPNSILFALHPFVLSLSKPDLNLPIRIAVQVQGWRVAVDSNL